MSNQIKVSKPQSPRGHVDIAVRSAYDKLLETSSELGIPFAPGLKMEQPSTDFIHACWKILGYQPPAEE